MDYGMLSVNNKRIITFDLLMPAFMCRVLVTVLVKHKTIRKSLIRFLKPREKICSTRAVAIIAVSIESHEACSPVLSFLKKVHPPNTWPWELAWPALLGGRMEEGELTSWSVWTKGLERGGCLI